MSFLSFSLTRPVCVYVVLCTYRSILLVVVDPQSIHHLFLIEPHLHQCNDSLQ